MMYKKYFFLLTTFFCVPALALIVGSDIAPSRQTAVTFPAADTNNTILGFAFMEGGFTLQNFVTTCSFNSYLSVAGTANLWGGNLYLLRDLEIQAQFSMGAPGTFSGNHHTLRLTSINPVVIPTMATIAFILQATYATAQDVDIFDWDYTGEYLAYAINGGSANRFGVLGFNGASLTSLIINSSIPTLNLNSIRFHPSTHYFALSIISNASNPAVQVWKFDPGGPTLTQMGTDLAISGRLGRAVSWHPSGDYLAAVVNKTNAPTNATVYVYPFDTGTGVLGSPITAVLGVTVTFGLRNSVDWAPGGDYLAVGVTSNSATELQLYYFDGATLTFTLGAEIGSSVNTVSWSKTGSFIAVGLSGSTTRLRVYEHVVQNGTLNLVNSPSGQTISVFGAHWRDDGNVLAAGRASGTGSEFFVYSFNKTTKTTTLRQSVDTSSVRDVRWAPGFCYVAFGSDANQLRVYLYSDGLCPSEYPLIFNNISLLFDSDILFKVPVVVQGNCIFDGHWNHIAFGPGSSLIIDSGASLLCKQLTMTTMSTDNLIMVDNNSSFSLQDMHIALDENFTFTQGFLTFFDDVSVTGTTIFTYASSRQAIIESDSTLFMDGGLTFSYDVPIASGSLFGFRDATSVWQLNDVTLHSTTTGLELTNGILRVSGNCRIESEAGSVAEGIKFGNGSVVDNVVVDLLSGAGLDVVSGYVVYNNV